MLDDLGILLLCSHCHKQFDPARHRPLCDCGFEDATWEPYIPLVYVPEEVVEKLRAEHLEANMKGGPRKIGAETGHSAELTEEELAAIQELENEGGPTAPATGEEIPPELLEDEGFSS